MPEQDVPKSNDPLDQGAEAVMPPDSGADDAPSGSAAAPVSGSSSGEDAAMEVDEGAVGLPPTSPVSREDDDLLDENEAVGVEAGLAHLTVLSPSGQVGEGKGTSIAEAPPPLEGEDLSHVASKEEAALTIHLKTIRCLEDSEPTTSEDSGVTLRGGP